MKLVRFFRRTEPKPVFEDAETPLTGILRNIIAAEGPIGVERFMQIVLQHPEHGYYRQGNPVGTEGDFSTAPEISQLFGEMIGVWCYEAWQRLGNPKEFLMLELGPGHGTMLQTAFTFTRQFPAFQGAMRLCLLESNTTLRGIQQTKLGEYNPTYVDDLKNLPSLPTILLANEFFDTMPLRQFMRTWKGWREKFVNVKNGRLRLQNGPVIELPDDLLWPEDIGLLKRGDIFEFSPTAHMYMTDVSMHISRCGGGGLIIDYGYRTPPRISTLDALKKHKFVDIFLTPGQTDVTAGVDFAMLAATAMHHEVMTAEPITQADFLKKMGISTRVEMLKKRSGETLHAAIMRDFDYLTATENMGTRIKVLEIRKTNSI
jgi:NADH dehydrogenase [ubiquinone] 1 alpha subcomplex assembly factor 7